MIALLMQEEIVSKTQLFVLLDKLQSTEHAPMSQIFVQLGIMPLGCVLPVLQSTLY